MTDKAYPELPKAHLPRGGFPDLFTADQLAAAVAKERERCAQVCERISDEYQDREGLKYPELKTDAECGANHCATAIRAGAKEPSDG